MFERKIYRKMLDWRESHAKDRALFLRGGRMVGKTTLAEKLGREAFRSFITIRFAEADASLKALFKDALNDRESFYSALCALGGTRLYDGESLLILDDVHLFPAVRSAAKTLLDDGRCAVMETGSEAPMTKESRPDPIPEHESVLDVGPMDFEEFLLASGDTFTADFVRSRLEKGLPMGAAHGSVMDRFREYVLVGGLPQAVDAFLHGKKLEKADAVKRRILEAQQNDIEKQSAQRRTYVSAFFAGIPRELAKRDKRYVLTHIDAGARKREYLGSLRWLERCGAVNVARNLDASSADLTASVSDDAFKCYLADTGLLVTLAGGGKSVFENERYKNFFLNRWEEENGMLVENAVAQCLSASGHSLCYFRRQSKEKKKTLAQIDFLLRSGDCLLPLTFHPANAALLKSVRILNSESPLRVGKPIVLHAGDIKEDERARYLPFYLAAFL